MITFRLTMIWMEWFICYIWKIQIETWLWDLSCCQTCTLFMLTQGIVFSQQWLLIITCLVFSVEIFHLLLQYFPQMIGNHLPRSILLVMISVGSIFQFILAISASSLYLRNTNKLMTRTATKITASTTETTRPTGSLVSFSMQKKIRSD